jgi:hypothetical protein
MPTLPFFSFGNVAILGDAVSPVCCVSDNPTTPEHDKKTKQAHAMTPFQGAGAGQAIEVSLRIFRVKEIATKLVIGCFDPSFAALK